MRHMTTPTPEVQPLNIIENGGMPDLDAMAAASRERARQTYPFRYLDREWHARYSVPFGTLVGATDGDMTMSGILDMVAEFVSEEEREAFKAAVLADKRVDTAELTMLGKFFNQKAQETVGNDGS